MTRPDTLRLFTDKLAQRESFTFVKFGDGEAMCMSGARGQNCDGHRYSPELGDRLTQAFKVLSQRSDTFIAEWKGPYREVLDNLIKQHSLKPQLVDYDSILHVKPLLPELRDFYTTLNRSKRRKIFVGPRRLIDGGVSRFLEASMVIEVPLLNSFTQYENIRDATVSAIGPADDAIVVVSAGMPAKPLIADLLARKPVLTCIDTGSAFDPLFAGNTRLGQAKVVECKVFYGPILKAA